MRVGKKSEYIITTLFILMIVSLIVTIITLSRHINERNSIIYNSLRENMRLHGNLITEQILVDTLSSAPTIADINQDEYARVESRLKAYAEKNSLTYVYFMYAVEKDGDTYARFLWDTDDPENQFDREELFALDESPNLRQAFNGNDTCSQIGEYEAGWESLLTAYHPVYDLKGRFMGVLGIDMSDITIINARKIIQETLDFSLLEVGALIFISCVIIIMYRKKATDAEKSSVAKTQFLSKMSHELRTPLTAVIGMLNMLEKSNDIDRIKQYYAVKMRIASNNLLQNINDILDMSKIETGKMTLISDRFDFEAMFRSVLDVMEIAAHEKNINIHVNMQPDMKQFFNGDAKRLSQIYMNLLSNAIKFTEENGAITVDVGFEEAQDGKTKLVSKVSDNGIGIPKDKLSKLFQNFSQIDNSLSRKYTGSGLGLVIVKNIVELMGGAIIVESEEGIGTSFKFSVILSVSDDQEVSDISPDFFDVLLIDDQEETCRYISDLFNVRGIKHMTAMSGADGIELVLEEKKKNHEFNVILVDYMMPDMNGIETIKELRKHVGGGALIMMISSIDWSVIEDDAKEAGITDFLQKPLLPSALINAINALYVKKIVKVKKSIEKKYDFSGKTILLVEDSDINREIAQFSLEDTNVACEEAEDGIVGVRMYSENPEKYELILMDIQMPNMDGFEATKRIRNSGKATATTIPIIAMTANVFTDQIEDALSAGMNAHLGKPLDAREMKELLAKYLLR